MASFYQKTELYISLCIGFYALLLIWGSGKGVTAKPVGIAGSTTRTTIRNFEFFAKLANPCEVGPRAGRRPSDLTTTTSASVVVTMDYYQSVAMHTERAIQKLGLLESNDSTLPICNGLSLKSLPRTPSLDNYTNDETIKKTYKSMIYLASHFYLMRLDRQTTLHGDNNIPDDKLDESDDLPTWRFRRCGNEPESFATNLQEVTYAMENLLCVILSGATDEQRSFFRRPFNQLQSTVLYRYHSACTNLVMRDCLVLQEAKQALSLIKRKFAQLISDEGQNENNLNADSMKYSL